MRLPSSRWLAIRLPARCLLAAGFGLFATFAPAGRAPRADTSPVVAKVGAVSITAADLERRMAAVPGFQLRAFGATPEEIKRKFLERVLIRDALLSQGAADRGLEGQDDIKEKTRRLLNNVLLAKLRGEAARAHANEEAEIKAYYEKNPTKFHSPERYAIWIIATRKQDEAKDVIVELHKDSSPRKWTELTRTRSIDGASAMRGGNLGFVEPDGKTPEPGLKVSPAVMEAVLKLKDGEISPEPVKDDNRWVVVWRKQTMKPVERTLETEAGSIRQMLLHARTDAKIKETIAALRKQSLTEHNPDLIDLFDVSPQGDLTPVRRPGALPTGRRIPVNPVPAPGNMR
jgi:peptidyl-prolyl cis-trans isomerase C